MALLSVSLEERWWLYVNRLEYRPQIEYKRQLKAKLKEYIQNSQLFDDMFTDEANLDADEFLPQDTVDDILYDLPISSVVKEAIEITPTDVLSKYIDAKEKLKQVIQYIEAYAKEQKETVLGQYIDAYINEEWDKVKEIENWVDEEIVEIDNHVEEVMFETYPMLKVLEDEWAEMEEVMIEELFPFEESTTAEEIFEDIERIRQEEELRLSSWFGQDLEIIKHMQNEEDVDLESVGVYIDHQEIQEDNHVCVFFDEQVDILKDYVYEIENLITNDEDEEAWEEVFELLDELVFEGDIAEEEEEDEDDDFTLDFSIFFDDSYDIDLDSLLSDSDVELEADAELETIEEGEEEEEKEKEKTVVEKPKPKPKPKTKPKPKPKKTQKQAMVILAKKAHKKNKKNVKDAKKRKKRLVPKKKKKKLFKQARQKQKEKLVLRYGMRRVYEIVYESKTRAARIYAEDMLHEMKKTVEESNKMTLDLFRLNKLERLQKDDFIDSLTKMKRYKKMSKKIKKKKKKKGVNTRLWLIKQS